MACLTRTSVLCLFFLLLSSHSAKSLRLHSEECDQDPPWCSKALAGGASRLARGTLAFGIASMATYPLRNLNLALRHDGHLESLRTTAVELLDKRGRPIREKNVIKTVRVPLPLAQVLPRLMEGSTSNCVASAVGFGVCMALHPILARNLAWPAMMQKQGVTNTVGQLSRLMLRGGSRGASQSSFFVQDIVISILEQVPVLDFWNIMRASREEEHTNLTYLLLYAGIGALTTPGEVRRHSMDVASLSWLRRDDKRVASPPPPPLFDGFLLTAARFALRGMLTIGSLTAMDAIARPSSSLGSIMTRGRRRRGGVREGGHVTLEEAMNYKVNDEEIVIFDVPMDPEVGVDLVEEILDPIGKKRSNRKRRRS
ncbi:hypothetical protein GUITHDRAFT_140117 [Guillardia theta CCMP2712]|uniref:Uncharacterized protein n=1 Tax=Guillardia theta (strain CCMP2712) TaxID=905079 RepID=L1J642_GUITC|nr:hypothetical protein GUITHDRAFT_140117 [Guillardia theta CCMP2712]EKX43981.1 hypothetical protein GUITHDRAFT_140117 [Guillardia theta CCMP2712]|eukprot:XP_005830961.1 hypothetical protein GUITHDRAFT_140117 [Guillardia theta CCMP2712]